MNPKFLYLVSYYVPTSHSDGGLINIVAETDEECYDLLVEWDDDTWPEHYGKLRENIMKAPRYELAEDIKSGVVEAFVV
jgi:hypothetical protein